MENDILSKFFIFRMKNLDFSKKFNIYGKINARFGFSVKKHVRKCPYCIIYKKLKIGPKLAILVQIWAKAWSYRNFDVIFGLSTLKYI